MFNITQLFTGLKRDIKHCDNGSASLLDGIDSNKLTRTIYQRGIGILSTVVGGTWLMAGSMAGIALKTNPVGALIFAISGLFLLVFGHDLISFGMHRADRLNHLHEVQTNLQDDITAVVNNPFDPQAIENAQDSKKTLLFGFLVKRL